MTVINGFSMTDVLAEGEIPSATAKSYSDNSQLYYDSDHKIVRKCEAPSNNIKFCYTRYSGTTPTYKASDCTTLNPSSAPSISLYGNQFRAINQYSKVCVQTLLTRGWSTLGCKYTVSNDVVASNSSDCYVADSCYNQGSQNSKALIPMTAQVMQCLRDSVEKVFVTSAQCVDRVTNEPRVNILSYLQNALRKAVLAALTLYVIFFGVRIALGEELPRKSEVFIFIIKMLLVLYFSVGIKVGSASGIETYQDGLRDILLPGAFKIANSLSNMLLQGGSSNGLCYFDPATYPAGYSYLALWDSLDCRVAVYLGITNPNSLATMILGMVFPLLFSLQIIFAIFCALFAIYFLSMAIYFVNTFMISVVASAFMVYLAPIFVPLALFRVTRTYFDSWYTIFLSFVMQPVVIASFLALVLTVFDHVMYADCAWTKVNVGAFDTYVIDYKQTASDACKNSFGYNYYYNFSATSNGSGIIGRAKLLFFSIPRIDRQWLSFWVLFYGIIQVTLMSYIFYHFTIRLSEFAAGLTGGPSLGKMAVAPGALIGTAMDAAGKALKAALAPKMSKTSGHGVKGQEGKSRSGVRGQEAGKNGSGIRGQEAGNKLGVKGNEILPKD
jgi:type IV secretion system protein VirB6